MTTVDLAFDDAYDRHAPSVYRYLRRLTGSSEAAEDLLQETFLKLHLQLSGGVSPTQVRAWLFRVSTNLARDRERTSIRSRLRDERYAEPRPVVLDFRRSLEDQEIIRVALRRVAPRMRQVLLLFAEGLTYREIAELTGIEVTYVGVLLHRGRAAFRRHLEELEGHGERRQRMR
jgi:RNA polymerase sigma-70 factor (ECF subfamily)